MFFFCVVMFFLCCFVFYFIKISKFALPGVMLMYEGTSNERKKETERLLMGRKKSNQTKNKTKIAQIEMVTLH